MPNYGSLERPIRVVVADDSKSIRDVVAEVLAPEFQLVGSIGDGRSLVDAVTKLRPDIAIVDIAMPIMDGIEAVNEIRRRGSTTKIVFLTVNEDRDFVDAAFEAGGNCYVVKRKMASDLMIGMRAALADGTFISSYEYVD
ncbi:MAG TPA: response regulator transcription factor [Pyrinomonadaceae bacterium]|nr:response regulator transcription factor [Pyrinomonadaceae bacterium]